MYLPAFLNITDDLGASAAQIRLSLTTFMIGLGSDQLLIGPLWPFVIQNILGLSTGAYSICSASTPRA